MIDEVNEDEIHEEIVSEKVDLKFAEVEEDEMHADDIKRLTRLAGLQDEMADEDKKDVDLTGLAKKTVREAKFATFKILEEELAKGLNEGGEEDFYSSADQGPFDPSGYDDGEPEGCPECGDRLYRGDYGCGMCGYENQEELSSQFKRSNRKNTIESSNAASLDIGAEVETPGGHGVVVSMNDEHGVCTYMVQHTEKDGDSDTAEYTADMVQHIGEELAQEGNPFDPMDAGPDYGFDDVSDEKMEQAAEYARGLAQDVMDSDEMVQAGIADLHGGMHSDDKEGTVDDMLDDMAGSMQKSLVANDMDVLEWHEIKDIASQELSERIRGPQMENYSLKKGSYDRMVTEMILDELKLGKNVAEIAQTLSFDEGDVSRIVDAATKVMESKKK